MLVSHFALETFLFRQAEPGSFCFLNFEIFFFFARDCIFVPQIFQVSHEYWLPLSPQITGSTCLPPSLSLPFSLPCSRVHSWECAGCTHEDSLLLQFPPDVCQRQDSLGMEHPDLPSSIHLFKVGRRWYSLSVATFHLGGCLFPLAIFGTLSVRKNK